MGIFWRDFVRKALHAARLVPIIVLGSDVAHADSSQDLHGLAVRIAADEAELDGLKAKAARDVEQMHSLQVADLFGESDDEKAAQLQHEQNQDANITTLNQRVGDLEESLRRLTGQVEQLDHRISELGDRITRMQKDFDYKLCSLAAQQLGATNGADNQSALPCGGQQSEAESPPPVGTSEASGPPVHLSAPPGVLGTLPESAVAGSPSAPPVSAPQDALADTRTQFDAAMSLLAKAQYDEARAAFRSFVDNNPKDELAPQAIYWVGDIAYVQKDFAGAAHAFAEGLKKYPSSPRAPESMLKLGQSLIALNQKKEGCLTLDALPNKYPSASNTVTERAIAARRDANCR
jgi:tol-pal system protein YbgF